MLDTSTLAAFLIAALTLVVIPGPAVMYIVARGVHQGRSAALVSALGIEIGTLIHVVAATLGVSALLVSSELAFSVVTYLGAVYLLYLGVQAFLERGETAGAEASTSGSLRSVFRQGVFVELLNPKTALFIFAFLPQFADPEQGAVRWQMLLLGALFVTVAICVDGLYGLLAGTLGGWLEGNACIVSAQRYVTGCVYVGLAATTVLAATGP